ncbi:DUF2064 domain-containing protein [uncultured Maribacter sp.]|uniref:TIGR04282 family arsenosugar biosynthesis glycosyltransferase n=1 Tax=uncultured Maribacter sp. TaxID=431308 RepID=UPI00262AE5C2|nr:DUF2064 domain-containing protein [uncultured Maribacter sp.]
MKIMKPGHTAIVFFAHSSEEELKHKKIHNGSLLFHSLTQKTLMTIKKSGLPYFHFTEHEQRGNSFGERFTNAVQSVFNLGYERVITIGNDTPHLTTKHLVTAASNITDMKSVFGASTDGGFYLMGFHKTQFQTDFFKNLPWQTTQLQRQVYSWASKENIEILKLKVLRDIDVEKDVFTIGSLYSTNTSIINALFVELLQIQKKVITIYISLKTNNSSPEIYFNKGSPSFQFS